MNKDFEERERFPFYQACKFYAEMRGMRHILDNGNNTYSIMSHNNMEYCDYCEGENNGIKIHQPKENAYEEIHKKYAIMGMKDFFRVFEQYELLDKIKELQKSGQLNMESDDWLTLSNNASHLMYLTYRLYNEPKQDVL